MLLPSCHSQFLSFQFVSSQLVQKWPGIPIATGGNYDAQTQMASFNFVEPYLRSVFGFLGVTDATFLTTGGTAALNYGKDRDAFLAPHLQAVQTHAHAI
jgi:FMN-dependent NADH-azoreductase